VVTEHWLTKMVDLALLKPGIGLVGPMSNYAGKGQRVEHVP
jgi:hypothetical protein